MDNSKDNSFNQFEYQNNYIKNNYDRISITVPKGEKAVIKELAAAAGESVNGYIYKAIQQRMASEKQHSISKRDSLSKMRISFYFVHLIACYNFENMNIYAQAQHYFEL